MKDYSHYAKCHTGNHKIIVLQVAEVSLRIADLSRVPGSNQSTITTLAHCNSGVIQNDIKATYQYKSLQYAMSIIGKYNDSQQIENEVVGDFETKLN